MNVMKLLNNQIIDRDATRKKVEGMLEKVSVYNQIGFVRREIRTTSSYEHRFNVHTHAVSKVTEQTAVYNVDNEERMQQLCEQVEQAVQCLDAKEQEIIRRRYLQRDSDYDCLLCHELNLSERTYRRIKAKAIAKLAFMLRLEVELKQSDPVSESYKGGNGDAADANYCED
jgi:ArpU family phage transcriptional regulator